MFYLTTHSTHFIYGYMASDIWLKDHSYSEKGNPLPPHRLLLSINRQGFFYMHHPTDRIAHTTAFVTPVVDHALNTFYLLLHGVGHIMVKDHSDSVREKTRCRHMGYSFRLAARVLLYALSHRQDNTYHALCYTSRGVLVGTRNSSMGPP